MTLTYPAALIALLAALTPIVIYLLLRRRKTEIAWGASYLLRLTLRSRRKSSLWKQLIVLAVRCLILALLALLLAQAWRPNPTPDLAMPAMPDAPVHRVLLYDTSLSMSARDLTQTPRLSRQRDIIERLLSSQRPGDHLTLLPLSHNGPDPLQITGRPSPDDHRQAMAAAQTQVEAELAIAPALTAAMGAFARTPDSEAQLFILSDFPRELEARLDELQALAPSLAQHQATVVPVNLAGQADAAAANIVIHELESGTERALAGLPLTLYIHAENFSEREHLATFDIHLDGDRVQQVQRTFSPNQRQEIPVTLRLATPGDALITVTTGASRLSTHGTRHLALLVKETLEIWLIADAPSAETTISDTEFFSRALNAASGDELSITVKPVTMSTISEPLPEEVDAVVLASPAFALPAAGEQLAAFVRRGGGLIITSSPSQRLESYNTNFLPVLPATLSGSMHETVDPSTFALVRSEPRPGSSALFRGLAEAQQSDFAEARYYNYQRSGELQPESQTIFELSSGDPLLLRRRLGRGSVYLLTTTLGIDWSSLPVRQAYMPFLFSLLQAATAGQGLPRNVSPGSRLLLAATAESAELHGPSGVVPTTTTPDGTWWASEPLTDGGYYEMLAPDEQRLYVATVQVPVREGDLRSLAPAAIDALGRQLGTPVHANWAAAVQTLGPADARLPLWPWLLALALLLYLFECWFVRYL